MDVAIYGAQGIALGVYKAIRELCPERNIVCFVVSDKRRNPSFLHGLPVRSFKEFAMEYSEMIKNNIQILLATPEDVMEEIERELEKNGFENYVRISSERWANMQKNYFVRSGIIRPLEIFPVGNHCSNVYVYMAVFYGDKKLHKKYSLPEYIIPIQVGATRTDTRIANIVDNAGDNISKKNEIYSELTGLYWIWKNRLINDYYKDDCYCGLVHYRRILDMSSDDLLRLKDNDIDVILPYPMLYEPDIEEHHRRYISDVEWAAVLSALNELYPEYAQESQSILEQKYFYNYNIVIAKKKVLETYCNWLFPLLFKIEKIINSKAIRQQNRYMGYIGETLETIYFMYNKNKFKIVHTGCKFLL